MGDTPHPNCCACDKMSEKDKIIQDKSFEFAVRIVKLYNHFKKNDEQPIYVQLLRSGTSIGANIAESQYASSLADFINKLQIALKEAHETSYWLHLLYRCDILKENEYNSISNDCDELMRLLTAIVNTSKKE